MKQPNFSICLIIPYFGKFPEWFPLFFETLRRNSTIDFIFFTDCDVSQYNSPNVTFHSISYDDYVSLVNNKAPIRFAPETPYKLCDIRPLYGLIHYEEIKGYDFYGHTDVDLLFGEIRSFYTDQILSKYDVLSTHEHLISGHLGLFRNTKVNRTMYAKLGGWKQKLESSEHIGIDESIIKAYQKPFVPRTLLEKISHRFFRLSPRLYLKEQYTTPFTHIPWIDGTTYSNQPDVWYYKDGSITNERDGSHSFMYLHFMNFRSDNYRADGSKAPWVGKQKICYATVEDMASGIKICPEGILPLKMDKR